MNTVAQNLIDAVSLGGLYALLALGLALVFGIMNLINFAHGDLLMVGGYVLLFSSGVHAAFVVMILAALAGVTVLSLGMERVAFRPVRNASPTTLLVTSFALSYFLENLFQVLFGANGRGITMPEVLTKALYVGGLRVPPLDAITIGTTIVLVGGLVVFLQRTTTGIQMRAAAEDFSTARLMGVKANRIIATAFGISGLLAGVVSVIWTAQLGMAQPTMGLQPVIVAFTAVVIGGMGSLAGSALGGFCVGFISIFLQAVLPSADRPFQKAFLYVVVILFLLLRPKGLIPARTTGRQV